MNDHSSHALDLESWGALTPDQMSRPYRRTAPPGDPIPEVAYAERTVRQLIYTFTKVNPAWVATVASRMEPSALASRIGLVAHLHGFDLDDVPGRQEARRLEDAVEAIAVSLLQDTRDLEANQ